ASFFEHSFLGLTHLLYDHAKRSFFLGRGSCGSARCARFSGASGNGDRRGGAHRPFFLELLNQSSNLQHRQVAQLLHQFLCVCHFIFLQLPPPKAFEELKPIAIGSDSFRFFSLLFVGQLRTLWELPSGRRCACPTKFMSLTHPPFLPSP